VTDRALPRAPVVSVLYNGLRWLSSPDRDLFLLINRRRSMKVCKRILAGLTLLLSAAGLLLSLAGGVGVWVVKGPVTAKLTRIFERLDAALDLADQGLDHVKASLARAAERLDSVREERRQLAQPSGVASTAKRFLARSVQQGIAPELGDAHEKLHTVAEAAVVVNSVLEDVGNIPFLSIPGLDTDRLAEINKSLSGVESSAWEMLRLLGESGSGSGPDAADRFSQVDSTLKTMQRLIAEYEPQLTQARQRTEALKSWTLPWITPAAALVSFVCFWVAISQVSLLCHAWSWWGRLGHTATRP
jgi:hypothetical protein